MLISSPGVVYCLAVSLFRLKMAKVLQPWKEISATVDKYCEATMSPFKVRIEKWRCWFIQIQRPILWHCFFVRKCVKFYGKEWCSHFFKKIANIWCLQVYHVIDRFINNLSCSLFKFIPCQQNAIGASLELPIRFTDSFSHFFGRWREQYMHTCQLTCSYHETYGDGIS